LQILKNFARFFHQAAILNIGNSIRDFPQH